MRTKRVINRWLLTLSAFVSLWSSSSGAAKDLAPDPVPQPAKFEGGRLERVQSLRDPLLEGAVPTYYTPGYESRARTLQAFFAGELKFGKRYMPSALAVSLAVLDPAQYALTEHQMPYPTPSCTGDPPVAMMPVSWVGGPDVLPREADAAEAVRLSVHAHRLTWQQASWRAYDLWGGHELGHALLDAYGINPGTRWMNEFVASYVLYAYLAEKHPELLWLIDVMQVGGQPESAHAYVALDDLESKYMQIAVNDPRNYLWYQAAFFEQIKGVYRRHGVGFLKSLRQAFAEGQYEFATLGTAQTLHRLDALDPGFSAWAERLAASPRTVAAR